MRDFDEQIHPVAPGCVSGKLDRYWVVGANKRSAPITSRAQRIVSQISRQLVTCKPKALARARIRMLVTGGSAEKVPAIREAFDPTVKTPVNPNVIVTDVRTARALLN